MRMAALGLALGCAACVSGPERIAPATPAPARFAAPQIEGDPGDLARWWTAFDDPVLTGLVEQGLRQNLDLAIAASRIRQARFDVRSARTRSLPRVDASAGVNRTELSENGGFGAIAQGFGGGGEPPGGATGIGLPGTGFTTWSLGFDTAWEIDLFGGARRAMQAARAREAASVWSARDTGVSLAAEIARTYFALRLLERRFAIASQELARQRRTLGILDAQARSGLVPAVDVERQRAQIAAAAGSIDPLLADARASVHALGILIGGTPQTLVAQFDPGSGPAQVPLVSAVATPPPAVPPGLPSDLLRRRADLRAAERRLAASTADIGVAVADLYPKLSLTGAAQLLSLGLSNLFEGDSLQLSGTAGLSFPLLDFGRRRATVGVRREQREQSYIAYQQTVLQALRETEDALVRLDSERRRAHVLAEGVRASRAAVDSIAAQYRAGLTDLTAVLTAQQSVLLAEDSLAQSEGAARLQTVALYKALGGGWESVPDAPPRAERAAGRP